MREDVDAAIPRQRGGSGVMGYVAEIQQFDDSMTAGPPAAEAPAAEPPAAEPPAAEPPAAEPPVVAAPVAQPPAGAGRAVGTASVPASPPAVKAVARVPQAEPRLPWTRAEVGLAAGVVAAGAAAIVGVALALVLSNRPPTGDLRLPLPPAAQPAAGASAVPTPAASAAGGPDAAGGGDSTAGGTDDPDPGPSPAAGRKPESGTSPGATAAPGGGPPGGPVEAAGSDLRATYARVANTGLLGLTGYRGQVTVTNAGDGAASGWEVTLSLPAGREVTGAAGAEYRQDGSLVTFTPDAATRDVGPGASVRFTFDVPGLLAAEPTGCATNGRPCG